MDSGRHSKGPFWVAWERLDDDRLSLYLSAGIRGVLVVCASTNTGLQIYLGRMPSDVVWGVRA